jgi:nitrate/nitrite transporter NarK
MGAVMGLVNAIGNIGGYVGPSVVGYLSLKYQGGIQIPFSVLGAALILAACLSFLLPKSKRHIEASPVH